MERPERLRTAAFLLFASYYTTILEAAAFYIQHAVLPEVAISRQYCDFCLIRGDKILILAEKVAI